MRSAGLESAPCLRCPDGALWATKCVP